MIQCANIDMHQPHDSIFMTKKPKAPPSKETAAKVRQDRIGKQLRRLYDTVAKEPVPDDFLRLLEEADDQDDGDDTDGGTRA